LLRFQFDCLVKQLLFGVFCHLPPSQIIINSEANGVNEALEEVALGDKINNCMA
jgi:hypothetical protein